MKFFANSRVETSLWKLFFVHFWNKFIISDIIQQTYQVLYSFACIYALVFSVSWYQGSYNHRKSSEKSSLDLSKDSQNRWNSISNHFQISLFVMTLRVWKISNTTRRYNFSSDSSEFNHQSSNDLYDPHWPYLTIQNLSLSKKVLMFDGDVVTFVAFFLYRIKIKDSNIPVQLLFWPNIFVLF